MQIARIAKVLAWVVLVGCSDDPRTIEPPENVIRPARLQVERLVPVIDDVVSQRISTTQTAVALQSVFESEATRRWNDRLDGGIKYADLFVELYGERDWTLQFVTADGLTDKGKAVLSFLEATPAEALDSRPYHVARIRELASRLDQLPPRDFRFRIGGSEAEESVEWLEENGADTIALIDALTAPESTIAPNLAADAQQYRDHLRPVVSTVAELEARLADGALRVARDLRHGNYKRLGWSELAERGGGKQVVYDRLRATFSDLTGPMSRADEVLRALRPPHVQYERLVTALERYRGFRQNDGGWTTVAPFDVEAGVAHPRVPMLRARLLAEGFAAGDAETTVADDDLIAAVHAYQRTHQFRPGKPTPGFWRSLNVDLERRIRQIELTLTKWRETFFRGEEDFVFVNIPDFHAEVYRAGERRMRFRVVVGNNNRVCDPETNQWTYPNATPVQWANLDHIMVNPWWNVPPRIFEEEIAEHADDADWLESKGYELWDDGGVTRARQRPGEGNALGQVKFIFPNPHNTYMHDTPHREYFEYPVRAFSHGCVRVHEPLELAAYFMEEYELGGRERLDRILELGSTIKLEFDEEIPVFFEYYTVRVDDDGSTMFLADPYRHDRIALDDDPAEVTQCLPKRLVDEVDETAEEVPVDDEPDAPIPAGVNSDVGP